MIVILDNIRSALNVGSIFRTSDALGIEEVFTCGITPEAGNPKVKKTALGAEKAVPSRSFARISDALRQAIDQGYQPVALELTKTAVPVSKFKSDKKIALVIGNEVSGVSPEALRLCDTHVLIPMLGAKESLNVSAAFAIAAYEISKKPL